MNFRIDNAQTFFDPAPSRQALGNGQGGLDEALRAAAGACPERDKMTLW